MHGIGLAQGLEVIPIASGAVVDTAEYEGVVFVCTFDAAAGSNEMQGQQGDEAGGGDQADIASALVDMDGTATVGMLEIHKPRQRYVSCDLNGAGTMVAIKYGARRVPVAQGTTTIATRVVGAA